MRRAITAGEATPEELIRFESSGVGKQHFDDMRAVFVAAIGAEEILLEQRNADNATANQTLLQVLSWGTMSAIVVGVVIALLLARSIASPLGTVVHAIQRIAQGDLDQKVSLYRKDEIGQLAGAFRELVTCIGTVSQAVYGFSRGDLSVAVTPRSEKDVLSHNMVQAGGAMRKLTEQATVMANDDLDNWVLQEEIEGDLGDAFKQMIQRMQFVAGQATLIANDDLYNAKLQDRGEGTLGGTMANMVTNLRRIQQDLKEQTDSAEAQHQHVLGVAGKVLEASSQVASAAEQLSVSSGQLKQGSGRQKETVESTVASVQQMSASVRGVVEQYRQPGSSGHRQFGGAQPAGHLGGVGDAECRTDEPDSNLQLVEHRGTGRFDSATGAVGRSGQQHSDAGQPVGFRWLGRGAPGHRRHDAYCRESSFVV